MKFFEKDLEQIIWDADKEVLSERGLFLDGKIKRQLKIGNYGIADLIHFKRPIFYYDKSVNKMFNVENGLIEIIELKNEKISVSAFMQAIKYLKGIKRYLNKRNFNDDFYSYKITLIGRHLDLDSSICYLPDLICNEDLSVDIITYSYDIDGIQFQNESSYKLTNEGF
jgi:hypothetical protein